MALRQQKTHRHFRAADVIQPDAARLIAGDNPVDQHHARYLLQKADQLGVAQGFGMNNQGITALADQHFDRVALFVRLMIAVADQQVFVVFLRHRVYRFHQRAEERVGDVHHHHAQVSLLWVASACALALGR